MVFRVGVAPTTLPIGSVLAQENNPGIMLYPTSVFFA
jgi:hypothetical protein